MTRPLLEGEHALLEPIVKIYPQFSFPNLVWLKKDSSRISFVFPEPPGEVSGLESYGAQFIAGQPMVLYHFTGPEGLRANGIFFVQTDHVARSETVCDFKECTQNFWVDGALFDTRVEENYDSAYSALDDLMADVQSGLPMLIEARSGN